MALLEQELRELHLFAGAGGGILGSMLLGHTCVCAVEIEEYPRNVLLARQRDGILPRFPIWDDITTFDGKPWRGLVDAVCGGFPCQAWSTAAAGNNTAKNMWPEMLRVVGEVEPRFVFCENVDEGAIIQAQKDLAECGFSTIRSLVAAADVGADHPRERWWLVADTYDKSQLGSSEYAEVAIIQEGGESIWQTNPRISGMVDGVANRVDRLKAIGNGQVPRVAALAWTELLKRTCSL